MDSILSSMSQEYFVTTHEALDALYEAPAGNSLVKEIDHINAPYRALIEAAPFFALATSGPDGMDCSPRGDAAGFVRVHDEKTLLIPDRRGNNRIDSLRNLLTDPRVALLFMIPGCGETLRVNGRAMISTDPKLTQGFIVEGKAPRCVIVVSVERVYYQCPKAIVRSKIWDPATWIDRKSLPTSGKILAAITRGQTDAERHDREYPERMKATIY
jgi:PPOX class probable FMN-dependent enzyme